MIKNQEVYKNKLETERAFISDQIKESEKPVDFGDDIDHFEEKGDEVEEIGNRVGIATDLKKRLDEVDAALEKIRLGKYGICEKCGEEIETEILDIDPESRLCKKDKIAEES